MNHMPVEITNFFLAMQAGPPGLERLKEMFEADAEYREPFSGLSTPHVGPDAIAAAFAGSRTDEFDDARIELGTVEVEGTTIRVAWTCFSKAIPGGAGSGLNIFEMRNGKIASLTTTLDQGGEE